MIDPLWKTAQQLLIKVNTLIMKPSIPTYCYLAKRNENMSIGRLAKFTLQLLHNSFKWETVFSYQELIDKHIVVYSSNKMLSNKQANKQKKQTGN